MKPADTARSAWQSQDLALPCPPIDTLRDRAEAYQRQVARRNRREYLAGAFVIPVFSFYIWLFPSWITKLGALLVVLGVAVVLWQLHRRAASQALPAALGAAGLDFHRQALKRQQQAMRDVWLWYIGPLVPGMAVFLYGRHGEIGSTGDSAGATAFPFVMAICAITFVLVIVINRVAARRLQREIDALDALAQDAAP